jgi:hypothetical protein
VKKYYSRSLEEFVFGTGKQKHKISIHINGLLGILVILKADFNMLTALSPLYQQQSVHMKKLN